MSKNRNNQHKWVIRESADGAELTGGIRSKDEEEYMMSKVIGRSMSVFKLMALVVKSYTTLSSPSRRERQRGEERRGEDM